MEVVFSTSAAGSLKLAGVGEVFQFDGGLSMGDISGHCLGMTRALSMEQLRAVFPEDRGRAAAELEEQKERMIELLTRADEGEPVRVWFSHQPDELCGLLWFLERVRKETKQRFPLEAVKLPEAVQKDGSLCRYSAWGEVPPEDVMEFLPLGRVVTPVMTAAAGAAWRELQDESGMLRAEINGTLHTVPEDFYDRYLEREIDRLDGEQGFLEAELIGGVIGRGRLDIGDLWLAWRVECMLAEGRLRILGEPDPAAGPYRRRLTRA